MRAPAANDARLAPFRPGEDGPFDLAAAAHLARRAEFGATPERIEALRGLGPQAAVAEVLAAPVGRRHARVLAMGRRIARRGEIRGLQAWWLRRMLDADRPFREHLALFWHDHFATSDQKVRDPVAMQDQNLLFLEKGSGPFPVLLDAVARDPAMLVWLDQAGSMRAAPNENFARELFELFTLGLGRFDEEDVKEAARAFTGWGIRGGRFHFNAAEHDPGPKRVFGRESALGGEDVLRLACRRAACPRFIATKLARWFVTEELDDDLEAALGAMLEAEGLDVGRFLGRLFGSRLFFAKENRGALVRSPVQLLVGALRTIEARVDAVHLATLADSLGQALFMPPSVEGWKGGLHWIDSAAMIGRQNFGVLCAEGEKGPLACRTARRLEDDEERAALWTALASEAPDAATRRRFDELDGTERADPRRLLALWLQMPEAQVF